MAWRRMSGFAFLMWLLLSCAVMGQQPEPAGVIGQPRVYAGVAWAPIASDGASSRVRFARCTVSCCTCGVPTVNDDNIMMLSIEGGVQVAPWMKAGVELTWLPDVASEYDHKWDTMVWSERETPVFLLVHLSSAKPRRTDFEFVGGISITAVHLEYRWTTPNPYAGRVDTGGSTEDRTDVGFILGGDIPIRVARNFAVVPRLRLWMGPSSLRTLVSVGGRLLL